MASARSAWIGRPSKTISRRAAGTGLPTMLRIVVLLPMPLRERRDELADARMSKSRPNSTGWPPWQPASKPRQLAATRSSPPPVAQMDSLLGWPLRVGGIAEVSTLPYHQHRDAVGEAGRPRPYRAR